VATVLNDSNAVSCTVLVFVGSEAAPFSGIWERKMGRIPRRPGMKTLLGIQLGFAKAHHQAPIHLGFPL